jgi:hypothetical protein
MSNDKELVGLALMFGSVCVLGWQVYEFLRFNFWTPVSVITALEWMKVGWAINPNDWIGLYNILIKTPLSLIMFVLGFFVLVS